MSAANSSNVRFVSIDTINRGITHATINMRGFAESCGCGNAHADSPMWADLSLARIGNTSAIVDDRVPEIAEALDGDPDHIVNVIDDDGVKRIVIWRRHDWAPTFIGLGEGFYLAPYWEKR